MLVEEHMRARRQLSPPHACRLREMGVSSEIIFDWALGVDRICPNGRTYQPGDGSGALIVPVFEWQSLRPNLDHRGQLLPEDEWPEPEIILVDLVAFKLAQPDRWWLRRGEPALVLGFLEDGARLFKTPLAWLQGGCEGVCIVNRDRLRASFAGLSSVVCEDVAHGEAIDQWLAEPEPRQPEVRVVQ